MIAIPSFQNWTFKHVWNKHVNRLDTYVKDGVCRTTPMLYGKYLEDVEQIQINNKLNWDKMHKEAKEVARQFKDELNELLRRYHATIELEDLPPKYAYIVPDKTIKVCIPAIYSVGGELLAEWTEIDLGSYLGGN